MTAICVSEKCQPPLIARKGKREIKVSNASGKGRRASETITLHVFEVIDNGVYITLIFVVSKELFTDEHETLWI